MSKEPTTYYVTMSRRSMLPVACHIDLKTATAYVAAQLETAVAEGVASSDTALFIVKVTA